MTLREQVRQRAHDRCEYCQSQARFATQSFALEHIEPRSAGGETTLENLAFSCQGCNNHKYCRTTGVDPVTQEFVPLFHPRRQRWPDHFAWDDRYERIVGLTPTGRATVACLRLNRDELVNLRQALYLVGAHPVLDESADSS